jgi:hypothetical protein
MAIAALIVTVRSAETRRDTGSGAIRTEATLSATCDAYRGIRRRITPLRRHTLRRTSGNEAPGLGCAVAGMTDAYVQ